MSKNIIHLNPEAIHTELKDLVKNSIDVNCYSKFHLEI